MTKYILALSLVSTVANASPFAPFAGVYQVESSYCMVNGGPSEEECNWAQVEIIEISANEVCIREVRETLVTKQDCLIEYRSSSADHVPGVTNEANFSSSATEARWTHVNRSKYYLRLKSYYFTVANGQTYLVYKDVETRDGETRSIERIHTLKNK